MTNLINLAEKGNAEAQYELSVRYFYGDGVPQDYAKALMWIQKAATKGLVDAQYDLAVCYEKGDIVEQNYFIAVEWYKKAAQNGHSGAMTNLALLYCLGRGCNQDYKLAIAWWEKAANLGDANAIYNLGVSYAEGKIIHKDLAKATELFLHAEELGCEQASSALANMDDEDIYEDSEFDTDEFTFSIDIARKIYQKLKTQEAANNEFYRQIEEFFIQKGKGFKEEDGNGVIGFEEIVYKNDEQTISVLVQFKNEPYVYGIILPTYGAYTRQLFNDGLSNKHLFGLPIFRMQWFDGLEGAFINFIDRESYLNYDTPRGRMVKAVDLGLSVMWGDCNLGANEVYQEGNLYKWTEIVPEIDHYSALRAPVAVPSSMTSDIAERTLGSGWKVPTKDHIIELMQNCEFEFIPAGGTKLLKVTGPNGNSIYLPLAGNLDWNGNKAQGGFYWTSTKATEAYNHAYQFKITDQLAYGYNNINVLQSVRPVYSK